MAAVLMIAGYEPNLLPGRLVRRIVQGGVRWVGGSGSSLLSSRSIIRNSSALIGFLCAILLAASAAFAAGSSSSQREEAPSSPSNSASHSAPVETSKETERSHRVEIRGEWFYVDGEPFLIKGVGYSPYRPGQVPWKDHVDPALMERDFERIAAAGFNTIRTWSPLSLEALTLADRHGLMVLNGIWVDRSGDYASPAVQETMLQIVGKEVDRIKEHHNILAVLVGNELQPEAVYKTGVSDVEALLKRAASVVKTKDPTRLVSYANWPSLSFLNASSWDAVCFNLYPYEPPSVSHAFGFRGYVEHLKRTARGKPLIITETGLSVSPAAGSKPGYGGLTAEAQQAQLVQLWDALFQGGAQGGVVFEWNDEWWKPGKSTGDAETHDANEAEEWFGLIEFPSKEQTEGVPRPAYEALKNYNQAVLLSPVSGERYAERIPVTVYAEERVMQVRVRLGKEKWYPATKLNRHWWKVLIPIKPKEFSGEEQPFVMEAYDDAHHLVVRRERRVALGQPIAPPQLSITTDRSSYEVDAATQSLQYTIEVKNAEGNPLANQAVRYTINEPQAHMELTNEKMTNAQGRIEGSYLVKEPGLVSLAAATTWDAIHPDRRVGDEVVVIVRRVPHVHHRPSPWEIGLPKEVQDGLRHDTTAFQLADAGKESLVDYNRYGVFHDLGTAKYRYEVKDWAGLSAAVGEGIYPNEGSFEKDPAYQAAKKAGKLQGSHWDYVWIDDPQLGFFRWAGAEEEPGVKQFYTALNLERAGLLGHAIKAYYAILVHFPTSVGWTAFDPPTPWYVGKVARDKIEAILRLHPELGMRLEGAQVIVNNGFDNDVNNDSFIVNPGRLVSVAPEAVNPPTVDLSSMSVRRTAGKGRVRLVQYQNGHWRLLVDGKPWVIQGMSYQHSAVGESPDEGTLQDWMVADRNKNGKLDAFESFVDANKNNRQDPDEPTIGDIVLLKQMGVNTLRLYHHANSKTVLRKIYEQCGIMVLMGDFVGMYTIGSGARWEDGTDYLDKVQRRRMFDSVKQMVREFKDEPYILMWVLGNENNYGGVHGIVGGKGNAGRYPVEYYSFINEIATWIHSEDSNHPVAIANGDLSFLDIIAKQAPAVDVFGANAYRGWHGFGRSFFEEVQRLLDKPVMVTEYGCPAYQIGKSTEIAERDQALYHLGNWVDLADNMAGRGVGNALGGVVFEWMDEWWKAGQPPRFSPKVHETQPNWAGPFPGGWNFEEWYGIVSQGNGSMSPYLRQLRLSYDLYKALWNRSSDPSVATETVSH